MEPLLVRFAFASRKVWMAAASSAIGFAFLLSIAISLAMATGGLVAGGEAGPVFVALAASLPGLLVQDAWRSAFFARGSPKSACWNDLSLLFLQAAIFAMLLYVHRLTVVFLIGGWGLAALVSSIIGTLQARLLPRPARSLAWFRAHRDIGPAFAADYIANRGAEQIALVTIGAIGGVGVLGAITAARSLFAPLTTMQSGLNSFAIPEAARLNEEHRDATLRRLSWVLGTGMAGAMLLGGMVLTKIPPHVGTGIFRGNWVAARQILIPMTVFSAVNALGYGLWIGLRGMQIAKGTLYVRGVFGAASIVGAGIGVRSGAANGALWALTGAAGAMAIAMGVVLSVSSNRREQARPAGAEDAGSMPYWTRLRLKSLSTVLPLEGRHLWVVVFVLGVTAVGAGAARLPLVTAALVGSAVLMAVMAAHRKGAATAMIVVASLPLFVDIKNRTLTLAHLFAPGRVVEDAGQAIQLSFVIVAALAVVSGISRFGSTHGGRLLGGSVVGLLLLCFSASIGVGELSGAGRLGIVYYAQTTVPLLAWYICAHSGVSPRTAARCVSISVLVTLLLILGVALTGAVGLHGNYFIVDQLDSVIPQYRNYFPFLLVCALSFAIARWSLDRLLGSLTIASTIALLPFMWSRTGIAMLVMAGAVAYLARPAGVSRGVRVIVAGIGSIGTVLVALQAVSGGVIGERDAIGSTATASGGERVQLGVEAISRLLHHPFLGDSFVPYSSVLAGGQQAQFARLFPAHNQYLDYGLRGGALAMVLLVVLEAMYLRRSWHLAQHSLDAETAAYHGALVAILVAVAIGNLSQLFVIQTWTGTVLFSLMGVCAACSVGAGRTGSGGVDASRRASGPVGGLPAGQAQEIRRTASADAE